MGIYNGMMNIISPLPKTKMRVVKHPKEIETLFHKYEKVFSDLPHGRLPDRGS